MALRQHARAGSRRGAGASEPEDNIQALTELVTKQNEKRAQEIREKDRQLAALLSPGGPRSEVSAREEPEDPRRHLPTALAGPTAQQLAALTLVRELQQYGHHVTLLSQVNKRLSLLCYTF